MLHGVTGMSPILCIWKKNKRVSKTLLDLKKISKEFKKRNLIPSEFTKFSWPLRMEKAKEGCTWRSCEILIPKHSHAQTVKSENRVQTRSKPRAGDEFQRGQRRRCSVAAQALQEEQKERWVFVETPNFWGHLGGRTEGWQSQPGKQGDGSQMGAWVIREWPQAVFWQSTRAQTRWCLPQGQCPCSGTPGSSTERQSWHRTVLEGMPGVSTPSASWGNTNNQRWGFKSCTRACWGCWVGVQPGKKRHPVSFSSSETQAVIWGFSGTPFSQRTWLFSEDKAFLRGKDVAFLRGQGCSPEQHIPIPGSSPVPRASFYPSALIKQLQGALRSVSAKPIPLLLLSSSQPLA